MPPTRRARAICDAPLIAQHTMESKATVSKNDVQRLFLQAVFSRGVLSEKLAMVIWAKCKDAVRGKRLILRRY